MYILCRHTESHFTKSNSLFLNLNNILNNIPLHLARQPLSLSLSLSPSLSSLFSQSMFFTLLPFHPCRQDHSTINQPMERWRERHRDREKEEEREREGGREREGEIKRDRKGERERGRKEKDRGRERERMP